MKRTGYTALVVYTLLLTSCGMLDVVTGKTAYKENLENIRLGITKEQLAATVGHPPSDTLNYPKYTVYEYRSYLNYLDDPKVSEAANLFKQGFDEEQNYHYLVNFFGVPPDNDSTYLIFSNLTNPLKLNVSIVNITDSAKPIYRLFGKESADYRLHLGKMKLHGRPLLMESKAVNACMIFENNRLKAVFAAYAPSQNRTQSCRVPLDLRNEYFTN